MTSLVLFLCLSCHDASGYNPKPNAKSVVKVGGARFTVLTERLVRMEWGGTNDEATFAFLNRDLPTPNYDVSKDGDATVIRTPFLKVNVCKQLGARKPNDVCSLAGPLYPHGPDVYSS